MNDEVGNLEEDLYVYYETYIPCSPIEYKENSVIGLDDLLYETLKLNISNNSNEPIELESIKLYINDKYEIQLRSIGNFEGTYNLNDFYDECTFEIKMIVFKNELKLIKDKLDPNMKYITIIIKDNDGNRYKYVTKEKNKRNIKKT